MWALESDSHVELLRLSATTIAEGKGTRIHYDVLPPESSVRDQVAQGLEENEAYRDLYRSALAEQIDAKLTNREFAIQNISVDSARVVLGALPHIRESYGQRGKRIPTAAAGSHRPCIRQREVSAPCIAISATCDVHAATKELGTSTTTYPSDSGRLVGQVRM